MRRLNTRFRGIKRSTDVLSFPLLDGLRLNRAKKTCGPLLLGDIVICVPKASAQAKEEGTTFHKETQRLLVHGLLHLVGYEHDTNAYQKRKMEDKEKELLDAL
jgi:probable rRNA maturation factor